ncbi:hypothetical protein [Mycobacterium bourgelatii]|uniref:Uncharacterized protein n=1 Tax=Mycobacterium bourgelatii TaxID=1273442 RepID=A0A7I9YP95_MYCBU|nr:hypothetical protein [Mycobacterium bourgelatii]MCV6975331.1 hypothetical protein [Mycobacterium bourgelatii]GFG90438.1 hypothetical protein MBOU_24800 [Mycobacterium bourgelatii]
MTGGYDYTAGDVVRNARARLRNLVDTLTEGAEAFPGTEGAAVAAALRDELDALAVDLEGHLAAMGGDPLLYDDGRPAVSRVDLTNDGQHGVCFVWDPRPDHPTNRPHVVASVPFDDGTIAEVIVVAPGVLDVVRRRNDCGGHKFARM